jgi:hypothetical protein
MTGFIDGCCYVVEEGHFLATIHTAHQYLESKKVHARL